MALFTGQQGYIPRMDMRAATLPGQLIGEGLSNIGKAIERNRYEKQKKQEKADMIAANRVAIDKVDKLANLNLSDEDKDAFVKSPQATQLLGSVFKGIEMKKEADQLSAIAAFHSQNLGQPSYEGQPMQPTQGLDASAYEGATPGAMQGMYQMSPEMEAVGGIIKPEALERFERTPSALPPEAPTTQEELSALLNKYESPEGVKLNSASKKAILAQSNLPTRYEKKKEVLTDWQIKETEQKVKEAQALTEAEKSVGEVMKSVDVKNMNDTQLTEMVREKYKDIDEKALRTVVKSYTDANLIYKRMSKAQKVAYDTAVAKLEKEGKRKFTEAEQKKILHAFRAKTTNETLERIMNGDEEMGYDKLDFKSLGAAYETYAWGPAKRISDMFTDSKDREQWQRYTSSSNAWMDSLLRYESGAAIPDQELARYRETYFPMPGDSDKVVADKKKIRDSVQMALEFGLEAVVNERPGLEGKEHMFYRDINNPEKVYTQKDLEKAIKSRKKVFDSSKLETVPEDTPAVSGDVISADSGDEIELLD